MFVYYFVFSSLYCIVGCLLFVIDIEVGPGQATIRLYHIYIKTRCLCSIVKLPIEMAGCQFDRRQYFLPILTNYRTSTAVSAGIEILRVKFGGNLTFPFCSHQIFSLMVMKIITVLVALQAVHLS